MDLKTGLASLEDVEIVRRAVVEGLAKYGVVPGDISVKLFGSGWIHLRVIHPIFEDATDNERVKIIMPILRQLPDDIDETVSMVMCFGPHAARHSIVSQKFDNPEPYPAVA